MSSCHQPWPIAMMSDKEKTMMTPNERTQLMGEKALQVQVLMALNFNSLLRLKFCNWPSEIYKNLHHLEAATLIHSFLTHIPSKNLACSFNLHLKHQHLFTVGQYTTNWDIYSSYPATSAALWITRQSNWVLKNQTYRKSWAPVSTSQDCCPCKSKALFSNSQHTLTQCISAYKATTHRDGHFAWSPLIRPGVYYLYNLKTKIVISFTSPGKKPLNQRSLK